VFQISVARAGHLKNLYRNVAVSCEDPARGPKVKRADILESPAKKIGLVRPEQGKESGRYLRVSSFLRGAVLMTSCLINNLGKYVHRFQLEPPVRLST
jgi:hypothetical protein